MRLGYRQEAVALADQLTQASMRPRRMRLGYVLVTDGKFNDYSTLQ